MITEILFDNRSEITDTEFIYTEIERAIIATTKKFTFEVGFQNTGAIKAVRINSYLNL